MIPGFRTFGGGDQSDFIDMTDPNVRSKTFKSTDATRANMESNFLAPSRGAVALENVRRETERPLRKAVVKGQIQKEQQDIFETARAGMKAESIADRKVRFELARARARAFGKRFGEGKDLVEQNIGRFAGIAMAHQQVDFSQEQKALHSQFGGGERFWGLGEESDTRVRMNNDLHPSRSNHYNETAGMFGFGGNGERSGLF